MSEYEGKYDRCHRRQIMAADSYKDVVYKGPFESAINPAMEAVHCTESDYDGGPGYDGDCWIVAAYLIEQLTKERDEARAENDRLREALAEIREIYAGSEGIPVAETAAEAYVVRLLEQMYTAAATALDY